MSVWWCDLGGSNVNALSRTTCRRKGWAAEMLTLVQSTDAYPGKPLASPLLQTKPVLFL